MPTQEERIAALEQARLATQQFQQQVSQFQQEAALRIRETEVNTTILLGIVQSQGQDIKRILEQQNVQLGMLEQILARLPGKDGD